jgi:hypothetical protein
MQLMCLYTTLRHVLVGFSHFHTTLNVYILLNLLIKHGRSKLKETRPQRHTITTHYVNLMERGLARDWRRFSCNSYIFTFVING